MTRERKLELQARVGQLNNLPGNDTQDHVTFTAFFTTEEEFRLHIEKLEERARAYVCG